MLRHRLFLSCLLLQPLQAQQPASPDTTLSCYTITSIDILGNKRTRPRAIFQEMRLRLDSTYCAQDWHELLEREKNWIYGMGLFDTVGVSLKQLPSGTEVQLQVNVKERWYLYPLPIFRISQYDPLFWWRQLDKDFRYVSYGLGLAHLNLRGLNDKLFSQLEFGNERSFMINYRGPYRQLHSGALLSWSAFFDFSQTRSLVYDNLDHRAADLSILDDFLHTGVAASFGISYRPHQQIEHELKINFQYRRISDTLHKVNNFWLQPTSLGAAPQRRALGLAYNFTIDQRDRRNYPLRGRYLSINLQRYGLGAFSEIDITRLRVFYGSYWDLGKKWYLSQLSRASFSLPLGQAYLDYETLNLKTEMRGYQNKFIQGPHFAHANLLLKRQLFHWAYKSKSQRKGIAQYFSYIPFTFYGYTYINAAAVRSYPQQRLRLNDTLLIGAGPGLELLTFYDVVLGVYYAFTLHGPQPGFYVGLGGGN